MKDNVWEKPLTLNNSRSSINCEPGIIWVLAVSSNVLRLLVPELLGRIVPKYPSASSISIASSLAY